MKKKIVDLNEVDLLIVKTILNKYIPNVTIKVFGSRAKNTAKKFSDLDIAIMGNSPISRETMTFLHDDFRDSDLPIKVDVVDYSLLDSLFKKIIDTDGILI